jgi:hypothetical protein
MPDTTSREQQQITNLHYLCEQLASVVQDIGGILDCFSLTEDQRASLDRARSTMRKLKESYTWTDEPIEQKEARDAE